MHRLSPAKLSIGGLAALARSHGPFVWAESGAKAVETAQALELVARMAHLTLARRPDGWPAPEPPAEKHSTRKHGSGSYCGR